MNNNTNNNNINKNNNNININNNDNNDKYFVVNDRNICTLLKKMTQQFYYVFTKNGKDMYSFKRTDKVVLSYKLIVKAMEIGILNI